MAERPREKEGLKTMKTTTKWLMSLVSTAKTAAVGAVVVLMFVMCAGPASAEGAIRIDRNCQKIAITVTAPAEGSYTLLGYREFGEEAGQTRTWAAHYEAGEQMEWQDSSYSTVTYRFVRGHAANPNAVLAAGPIRSERNNC